MRILFSLFFILTYNTLSIFCQTVEIEEAKSVAKNFYTLHHKSAYPNSQADKNTISMSLVETKRNKSNQILYYIFENNHDGYVIVSGNKGAYPVLAYSFHNSFTYPISCPATQIWMQNYEEQINYIINNRIAPTPNETEAWNRYLNGLDIEKGVKTVLPLLLTNWNQNEWYNEMCPDDTNGPGEKVYAGCVAISMAQIMKYYNYPIQGTGSKTYNSSYGQLSANFGNTFYRWNEMLNSINQSNTAVAEIIYHSGISVNMSYSPNGSSASTTTASSAMKSYFGYHSDASYKTKYLYSTNAWNNLLITNLDNGRPMIYSGSPSSGSGHAWNCDGYQGTDHFHMNWGWGGAYNGYFYLNALNVGSSNFNFMQGAVVDLYPESNFPYFCSGTKNFTSVSGTFEDGSSYQNYQDNSDCYWLIEPLLTVSSIKLTFDKFETEIDNDIVTVYDGGTTNDSVIGIFSGSTVPQTIISSGNKMLIHFESNGSNAFSGFHASYSSTFPIYCSALANLTNPSGIITDGSDTNTYNPVTNCRWRIVPPGINAIELSFNEFNLNDNKDFLEIYDIASSPVLLDSYTGNSLPPTKTYHTEKIMLWLKTNSQNPGTGFNLSYSTTAANIESNDNVKELIIYPNPVNDIFTVSFLSPYAGDLHIEIINMTGQKVHLSKKQIVVGSNIIYFETKNLSQGIYFLNLITDKELVQKKIIIQH